MINTNLNIKYFVNPKNIINSVNLLGMSTLLPTSRFKIEYWRGCNALM